MLFKESLKIKDHKKKIMKYKIYFQNHQLRTDERPNKKYVKYYFTTLPPPPGVKNLEWILTESWKTKNQ